MDISLSKDEFIQKAAEGNLVPLFRQILGDTLTPISIFHSLGGDEAENSFLLESVMNGERLGRYTFVGVGAKAILRGEKGKFYLHQWMSGEHKTSEYQGDPLKFLEDQWKTIRPVVDHRLPDFHGGAVGFLSYDSIRYYEEIPDQNPDVIGVEDAYLIFTDEIILVDHIDHNIRIVVNVNLDKFSTPDDAYEYAKDRLMALEKDIYSGPFTLPETPSIEGEMKIETSMSDEEYKEIVKKAKKYIYDGDIFQVVLSRRFSFDPGVSPFTIYRALRSINPSPYMFYLNAGPYRIVGSSPEILVRVKEGRVTIRPIAGTRRRGQTREQDIALEEELHNDEKEVAEHIMLVDLGRNDAGRVSRPGTVQVTEFKVTERYSHVMHIVSNCEGELREDISPLDALRSALPAGTLSGAPKIRAMEIIDELETVRRGIYGGCVGPFHYNGEFDMAIAIRTLIFKDGIGHLQGGAGIVYDSDPEKENDEVARKAEGIFQAVRFARRGLK